MDFTAVLSCCWKLVRPLLWPSNALTPDPQDLGPAPILVNSEPPITVDNTTPESPSPAQPNSPLTAGPSEHANRAIANLLHNAAGLPITPTPGFVYILTATHNDDNGNTVPLIKIGYTTQSVTDRLTALQRACPSLHLQLQTFPLPSPSTSSSITTNITTTASPSSSSSSPSSHHQPSFPTQHPRHVERLAHAELARFRYIVPCPDCPHRHKEFFTVDAGVARRVVARWARFCGGVPAPWESVHSTGSSGGGRRGGSKNGGATLAAPWRVRLEGCAAGLVDAPVLVGEEGVGAGMALWDGFVDASVWAWVWYDVRLAGGVVWRDLLWVVGVSLAVRGALWFRSLGWTRTAWGTMFVLVVMLAVTALRLPMGSTYTWAALGKALLWLTVVILLAGFVGGCLYLGWELPAWVLAWMLVGVLMCLVLMLMGFRCVTAEYLCRRA